MHISSFVHLDKIGLIGNSATDSPTSIAFFNDDTVSSGLQVWSLAQFIAQNQCRLLASANT